MKTKHLIISVGLGAILLLGQLIIDTMSLKGFFILIPFTFIFIFNLSYVKRNFESNFLSLIYNFVVYFVSVSSLAVYIQISHSEYLSEFNLSHILKYVGLVSILSFLNFLTSLSIGRLSHSK